MEFHQTLPCVNSSVEGQYIEAQTEFVSLFKPDALQYIPKILDTETQEDFYVRTTCWLKFAVRYGLDIAKTKVPLIDEDENTSDYRTRLIAFYIKRKCLPPQTEHGNS